MQHTPDLQSLLRNPNTTRHFFGWLREEGDNLIAAAKLLGGANWTRCAQRVVGCAQAGDDIAIWRKDLYALRRLLYLEFTDDLESEEAHHFIAIHPDDPRADEARICAEALDRGLNALEDLRRSGLANVREAA